MDDLDNEEGDWLRERVKRGSRIYEREILKLLGRSGFVQEKGHETGLKTEPRNGEA